MTITDKVQYQKLSIGSQVYYQGIPEKAAIIKAISQGKAHLKYRGEKGRLVVPLCHCKGL